MVIVNFAHPVTEAQRRQIEILTNQPVERIIDVPAQFAEAGAYSDQAVALVEGTRLSAAEWQTAALIVNLPSLNTIAALVLAEIHGRAGYFPAVLRLRAVAGATPRQFEVAEIIDLQRVRDAARVSRG